jgi:hypothetical protein
MITGGDACATEQIVSGLKEFAMGPGKTNILEGGDRLPLSIVIN